MKSFKGIFSGVLLTFIILGQQASFASFIPIVNPSFETPALAAGGFNYSIPGWTVSGSAEGVWNPAGDMGPPPDGVQVGYINYGTVSQTLTTDLLPNTTYTLSIWVGGRYDGYNPGTDYSMGLYGGAALLASVTPVTPLTGSWTDLTATYTTGSSVTPSTPLGISISTPTEQLDFDDVTLSAITPVPEPTTMISGALLLLPFGASTLRILRKGRVG